MVESGSEVGSESEDEPPPMLLFRKASHRDLDSILSIERICFSSESFTKKQFEYMLKSPSSIAFIALCRGEIVGYIWAYIQRFKAKPQGRIYSLAVKPEFREQGIARNLLLNVELEMQLLGVERIFLEVEEFNEAAKRLYINSGFKVQRFLPAYYGKENAYKMIKKLVHQ
ncbi:MAG: N-acetyltransferase [Halobacteria archaeon]